MSEDVEATAMAYPTDPTRGPIRREREPEETSPCVE
jgi:hypothetical protein